MCVYASHIKTNAMLRKIAVNVRIVWHVSIGEKTSAFGKIVIFSIHSADIILDESFNLFRTCFRPLVQC